MLTSIKNPQANAPVERVHQVLNHMFLTKNLNSQIFDYIDPWGEILSSIAWAVRALHHTTLDKTPAQLVFDRDMIFNLSTAVVNWRAITLRKQKQVDRDNLCENARRITHDYAEQDKVFVIPDGINQNWTIAKKVLIQSHKYIQTAPSQFNKATSMQE